MRDSSIWTIDEVAAANLSRALGDGFTEDQVATIAKHMSYHRRGAIDLLASRIRANVLGRIERAIADGAMHRSDEWSDGCRTAEAIVIEAISPQRLSIVLPDAPSKGQILRKMLGDARRRRQRDYAVVSQD
jgi:hypothetical protein